MPVVEKSKGGRLVGCVFRRVKGRGAVEDLKADYSYLSERQLI